MVQLTLQSKWGIQLEGDAEDLENLTNKLNGSVRTTSDLFVARTDGVHRLATSQWEVLLTAAEVTQYARETLRILTSALRLLGGSRPITLGTVYETMPDGTVTMSRVTELSIMSRKERKDLSSPQEFRKLLDVAQKHPRLADSLSSLSPPVTLFDVYKTIESLKHHFTSEKAMLKSPLVDPTIDRIKQMANSYRHAGGVHLPPSPPIQLDEAVRIVSETLLRVRQSL
jgi:hypothetical protein